MKAIKFLFLTPLLLFFFISCSNDDDNGDTEIPPVAELSIYETAAATDNLTTLTAALERTGLDAVLSEAGTYTVFAPTDEAFTNAGVTSLDDFSDEELTDLLLNHVLGKVVLSTELNTGYENTLAQGPGEYAISLFINVADGVTLNGTASPVSGGLDIEATNGVIHLIDTPLNIPNVVDHIVGNPEFEALTAAVTSFGEELTTILSGEGPFTIFAPTNAAFENLADVLGVEEVDQDLLRTILLYHVVAGQNLQTTDLMAGMELTTANEESLFMDSEEGTKLVDGTGGEGIGFNTPNIQGSNGVIHMIDRVLLPPSIVNNTVSEATIYQLAKLTPGYASLALAIERAGLVETLSDPNAEFTVFAPDDQAFIAYLSNFENINSLEDIPVEDLANLLLNHLVQGKVSSSDLVSAGSGYANTLAVADSEDADNISLYFNTENGVTLNGMANVVFPDFEVSNGIVHLVDNIIELPTVVTFATADPNFSTLVEALTSVEESAGYVELLQTPWGTDPAPFTVFAPDNAAFTALLEELEVDDLGGIAPEVVEATLAHHVITGANVRSDDITAGTVTTAGGDITLDTDNGVNITDANGRVSNVTAADVQAINGVIHVIDKVILPPLE